MQVYEHIYGWCVLFVQPVLSETPLDTDAGWKVITFARTPIMSTYLVAFVVGEYDFVEATDADGVLVRVYTPIGKKDQGHFALEVGPSKHTFLHPSNDIEQCFLVGSMYVCALVCHKMYNYVL